MTATNATVRRTAFNALNDITGINRYEYPPEKLVVPAAVVAGLDITRTTFDGAREIGVSVVVAVSHSDASQIQLMDQLLDPSTAGSVLAALESVSDADGVSLAWRTVSGYGEIEWGGTSYYGAVVSCTAYV